MECFVMDMILTHFEAAGVTDPNKLNIQATFGSAKVNMTPSTVNVTDFKTGAGVEMKSAKGIQKSLQKCGLTFAITYNKKPLGTGQIIIPDSVIEQITPVMPDLMYVGGCNVERDGEVVGKLEALCRLVVKCEEKQPNENNECSRNANQCINQQDILFVLSEARSCPADCEPCHDAVDPEEGDGALQLDLSRYQSPNTNSRAAEVFTSNMEGNSACCTLKMMANECEELIDSLTERMVGAKPLTAPCRHPEEEEASCNRYKSLLGPMDPSGSTIPCFSYIPARQGDKPDFCSRDLIPAPISNLRTPSIKPQRFCPICLTNMSWLPKFANCPKCGVKPMPVIEERHKQEKLTPEKIIEEFLGKPEESDFCVDPCKKALRDKIEGKRDDECHSRCTCKLGKLCAHCRTRKLVVDVFQSKEVEGCPKVKPDSSEDFCIQQNNGDNECRTYLSRVFSELRVLYEIKDTKKPGELAEYCKQKQPRRKMSTISSSGSAKEKRTAKKQKTRKERVISALHKLCMKKTPRISRKHGWAWSSTEEALKKGWRPGYVLRPVNRIMKFFLQPKANDIANTCNQVENAKAKCNLPILNICKKNGEICVTLRPISSESVDMKPIVFKIVKSDLAVALSEIKKVLKAKGFPKCTCHQPLMLCVCRSTSDKKYLEKAVQKECKRRDMDNCVDHLVLTDTTESDEMEYDFDVPPPTPPEQPHTKPNLVNASTQFNKKDLKVQSKYPRVVSPYWRAFNCAAGDRYTGTAFGVPGENVFEDGMFGYYGGGPHGPAVAPGGRPKPPGIWGAGTGGPMRAGQLMNKMFPGYEEPKGKSGPIPVRMQKRYYDNIKKAKQAEKDAIAAQIAKRKRGIDVMNYLREAGTLPKLWDPNDPSTRFPTTPVPAIGPDGLTDAQRRRQMLRQTYMPPFETICRRGNPDPCNDPCESYNVCPYMPECCQCCQNCCYS